jgi:hypothetical protein
MYHPACLLGSSSASSSIFLSLLSSSCGGARQHGAELRRCGSLRRSRPRVTPGRSSCTLSWATVFEVRLASSRVTVA